MFYDYLFGFFYRRKQKFLAFLQFKGNFERDQNSFRGRRGGLIAWFHTVGAWVRVRVLWY